jgi:hypothetical protein
MGVWFFFRRYTSNARRSIEGMKRFHARNEEKKEVSKFAHTKFFLSKKFRKLIARKNISFLFIGFSRLSLEELALIYSPLKDLTDARGCPWGSLEKIYQEFRKEFLNRDN